MINASTPFLVEAYDQGELNRILLAAEQTSEQFRNEVIATVQAFCLQHREHIFGCVMDTHRDTIGIIYGTKQMDDDLMDLITEQDMTLFQKGWENMLILQGPGTTPEELKGFSDFALPSHYDND
jgi:hypothetical protein